MADDIRLCQPPRRFLAEFPRLLPQHSSIGTDDDPFVFSSTRKSNCSKPQTHTQRCILWLQRTESLSLSSDPLADVRWTVAEFDALGDAGSKKAHRLYVDACDFRQIECDVLGNSLEFSLQFQNSFGIDSTAESKNRFLFFRASVNFESHVRVPAAA